MSNTQPVKLGDDAVSACGISTLHERMQNGELRFRLMSSDGSAYIRTVSGMEGAWQKSHFHKRVRETYVVEKGWMVLAEWDERLGRAIYKKYGPGDVVTTEPLKRHNVYLPSESVIHTVKHSATPGELDWYGAPELDAITHAVGERELLEMGVCGPTSDAG